MEAMGELECYPRTLRTIRTRDLSSPVSQTVVSLREEEGHLLMFSDFLPKQRSCYGAALTSSLCVFPRQEIVRHRGGRWRSWNRGM